MMYFLLLVDCVTIDVLTNSVEDTLLVAASNLIVMFTYAPKVNLISVRNMRA